MVSQAEKGLPRFLRLVVSKDSVTDDVKVSVVADGLVQEVALGPMSSWNLDPNRGAGYGLGRQDAVLSPRFPLSLPPAKFIGVRVDGTSTDPLVVYGIMVEYEPVAVFV